MKQISILAISMILSILFVFSINSLQAQNVGIGTTTPISKLHVEETTTTPSTLGLFKLITTAPGGLNTAIRGESAGNGTGTYYGAYGTSVNTGTGDALGVEGYCDGNNAGTKIGLEGIANGTNGANYGTRGWAIGLNTGPNYGLYGSASGGSSNWAGYFGDGQVYVQNNIGIGIVPTTRLHVSGSSTDQAAVMQLIQTSTGHGIRSNIESATPLLLGNPSAIVGDAVAGNGIAGTALTGTGVYGYSNSGVGVFGTSTSNAAVKGFCIGSGAGGQFFNTSTGAALLTGPGNVGIDVAVPIYKLDVTSAINRTGNFVNSAVTEDFYGLYTSSNNTANYGIGIRADAGYIGIESNTILSGAGNRFAFRGIGANGTANNYGIHVTGSGGSIAFGIFAQAFSGTTNYAGYFSGDVFCSGTYLPSDRKLKTNILPLKNALAIVEKLNPSVYTYKTSEYDQMQLPTGLQYGLIADEVKEVLPGAVKRAVQPADYLNQNDKGKKLHDEVEFNAVNYMQVIPVLIGAVKEQQTIISSQQIKIDELEKRLSALEKKEIANK